MSITKSAHDARQSLSQALEVLQSAGIPAQLASAARPLAESLRVLVEIEKSPRAATPSAVESVLGALREGLKLVQLPQNLGLPAAERAMSAIAEALGRALELSHAAAAPSPAPAAPPVPTAGLGAARPPAGAAGQQPSSSKAAPEAGSAEPLRAVEAALGAHSATNFYKGLASGDIVTSGGLFVATYQLPRVGQTLLLKVSMPGGYSFEAKGVVAWTREVPLSATAPGATPGFGAQICEISDEGRGLIQRYVRNREPLFHDDL